MKAKHLAWLLAYPAYQIIGTARHELSHAAAAILQGAHVTQVQILPSHLAGRGWYWGYMRLPDWVKANIFILGVLSPWLNMAYNYRKVFLGTNGGDVGELMCALDPISVNGAFILSLLAMGAGAVAIFRSRLLRA